MGDRFACLLAPEDEDGIMHSYLSFGAGFSTSGRYLSASIYAEVFTALELTWYIPALGEQ
jgi:hypothetical protein